MFHRFFLRRIDELMISMEQEAVKLAEILQGENTEDPRL
jgi:biopolymer transport protein ExbB